MADNFLEKHREEYELKKQNYLRKLKHLLKIKHRRLDKPEDDAL